MRVRDEKEREYMRHLLLFFFISLHTTCTTVTGEKRVLITGGAGFIGFHLARRLASHGHSVVVLDNFNNYYHIQLKIDRAYLLYQLGVHVYYDDVCNNGFLYQVFEKYNFTHVVHMAAMAGVRNSLHEPLVYATVNVECQLILLEVIRHLPTVRLLYASSSSVYGKKSPTPFQLSSDTTHPGNMYAATKKTGEMLMDYYCRRYHIDGVIGLRFFTVYGPWGRPDMAVYKFTQAVLNKQQLPLYYSRNGEQLSRDFTYIDDIIDGVTSAMDFRPVSCGQKFNLGRGHSVPIIDMIHVVEQELGLSANIRVCGLPPTEILKTLADISETTKSLKFHPTVDLREGVKRFIFWFQKYVEDHQSENVTNKTLEWFNSLKLERERRDSKLAIHDDIKFQ